MLIRNARLDGRPVDLRLAEGRVVEIGVGLRGEELLDANGATVLPGLVDHHLHLHAIAAAMGSVQLRGVDAAAALHAAPTGADGWVRAVGAAGSWDAAAVDALHASRPVRVQHGSGALWTVNSLGARLLGLGTADHPGIERDATGAPTGRLWRADAWLRERLPNNPPDLAPVGALLARHGITAVTDATPDLDTLDVSALPQHVTALGIGLDTSPPPGVTVGPYKLVLCDHDLPDLDELAKRIAAAHATGRAVAVHCVTREALALLLAAFDAVGARPGDRLEHAAVVPAAAIPLLAGHRLRVVTQPGFLADRGHDYRRDIAPDDHRDLYRCASLRAAGIPLALSSDAPHGPVDPWAVIDAAVTRVTPDGEPLRPAECLDRATALAGYLAPPDDPGGPPRRVTLGAAADLVLRSPEGRTVATVIAGHRVA